jgi:hypothetical protein
MEERPKAKVKYTIQATLCSTLTNDHMKYKQVLIIREPPVAFQEENKQSETVRIKTCCCCDKGTSTLSSVFDKNIFLPNEVIKGFVAVDNSRCTINCTRVEFALEQRFQMIIANRGFFGGEGAPHGFNLRIRHLNQSLTGPNARQSGWKENMSVDLSEIQY